MRLLKLLVVLFCVVFPCGLSLQEIIRVGGLFDAADTVQETAFRYAINRINVDRSILPRTRLSPQVEHIPPRDSFHASKRVCHLARAGVAAIFGPASSRTATHVQSICDALQIPHIETRWDYRSRREDYLINLYPHPHSISRALLDMVRAFQWKSLTILYEDQEGLVRMQELLEAPSSSQFQVTLQQLPADDDFIPLLKELKNNNADHFVLDCTTERIPEFFRQAQQIKLVTVYHQYIITSLDLHTIDLEEFYTSNITGIRLVDPNRANVQAVIHDWIYGDIRYGRMMDSSVSNLKTETALIYDAIHLFSNALHVLDLSQRIEMRSLGCDGNDRWQDGHSLINYMKMGAELEGLTGTIRLDSQGFRTHFNLEMVELSRDGFNKVAVWSLDGGLNSTRSVSDTSQGIGESMQNKTLIIILKDGLPYSRRKENYEMFTGNDQYEGYGVDLAKEITSILNATYVLRFVADGEYGRKDASGKWNGMIKELMDKTADVAIADLTINSEREAAVDFTMPFMNLGISILYKKPRKDPPNLFSFLSPLSIDVWIYTVTAYMGVSVLLFVLARISPYEWESPHPCDQNPEELVNQLNLLNCLWFGTGSLTGQGCDILPKAVSTRMVAGIWWFFTLIMISSYTANLAAFLTMASMDSVIQSAEDLAKQTSVKYGTGGSGTTRKFFETSEHPTYKRMWTFMDSTRPSVFVKSNQEGQRRVQKENGKYAFFMESVSIEYITERECDLVQIGGLLDSKGYGVAMPPGSPYKNFLNNAVLLLQERGILRDLKNRWWKSQGGGQCMSEDAKSGADSNELGMANVGGVFVVLLGGMGLACVIAVFEFLWKSRKLAMEEKESIWLAMGKDLKMILLCKLETKPVDKKEELLPERTNDVPQFDPYGFNEAVLPQKK